MFSAVHLYRIEAGVAGLASDCRAVGAVAGALGDEAGAQGVTPEFSQRGGVVAGVFGTAADGLVDRSTRERGCAEVAVLGDGPEQMCTGGGAGYSPTAHVPGERFSFSE